jgi:hypothetical protein
VGTSLSETVVLSRTAQKAREPYEGRTKAELSEELAQRGLPKTGNVNDLIDRLVDSDNQ